MGFDSGLSSVYLKPLWAAKAVSDLTFSLSAAFASFAFWLLVVFKDGVKDDDDPDSID